ncbi:hypothetical protein [Curtobacterium sp. MCPF17_003]|uniref:hypothetical protein n=1 Tax=Curtobacterium sp. MCPF17_003 TaxID=2175637 RepID=UPI0011B3CF9B|nr:hypothetical protein [Curtobacterium sp. MCPF17_003]
MNWWEAPWWAGVQGVTSILGAFAIPGIPPVLDARSDPETLELRVPRDLLPSVWIGVEWVVPRRYGSFAAAARVEVKQNGAYERWEISRWWRWPRKEAGRWIRGRDISVRSPLRGPR